MFLVWAFTASLFTAAVTLWAERFGSLQTLDSPMRSPWPLFVLAFAVGNFAVVRVEFHNESHSLNLSDAALLPAIVFCRPEGVVLAAILGYLCRALWVQQSVIKAAFNVALHAFVAVSGVLIYYAVLQGRPVLSPTSWLAGAAVILAACLISDGAVQVVIGLSAGRVALVGFRRVAITFATTLLAKAIIAFLAVHMLADGAMTTVLFVLSAVVIAIGYAGYGRLQSRHATLTQLYRFDQALAGLVERDDVVAAVLEETLSLLNVGVAQMIVNTPEGMRCHTLRAGDHSTVTIDADRHPLATPDHGIAKPVVASRGSSADLVHQTVVAMGFRDAAVVPVPVDGGTSELLVVADRLGGDHVTFHEADVALLDALAAHAAMALRSCRLLEELRREVAVKEHQASHDTLTGLANRALFAVTLDRAVAECPADRLVGVLLLDLDGFKTINDTMGHDVGDALLQELGTRLAEVVGDQGLIARLGGDEFAVVVPVVQDVGEVHDLAERFCLAARAPVHVGGTEVAMRISVGLTVDTQRNLDRSALLRQADVAMYKAKRDGLGVAVYDESWNGSHPARPTLISALRGAIDASTLQLKYQPKVDIATGRVSGAEALLRWTHPTYGVIGPEQAIPVAERSGLIRPLTLWVLEEALHQLAEWRKQNVDIGLAVNLSPTLLADPGIVDDVSRLLRAEGIPAFALTLELTESVLAGDRPDGGVAERLAYLGLHLSIDDYGTGTSSLARLKDLPVSELKLDKSFIAELPHSKRTETIVASTVALAHDLGLTVVAEGVETRQVWHKLHDVGCDTGQGFFLCHPLPGDEFLDWFHHRVVDVRGSSNVIPLDARAESL